MTYLSLAVSVVALIISLTQRRPIKETTEKVREVHEIVTED